MSKDLQFIYTTTTKIPPSWREEQRNAQEQTPQLVKPVEGIVCADVDPGGLAIGEPRTFFKSLPQSKKIGDSDILTTFADWVRSAMDARDQAKGSRRTKLFIFLSYVAVVATRVGHGPGLEALEDAMQMALGTQKSNGKPIALGYLKTLRTGAVNLHRVINGLVAKDRLPAHATSTAVSRAYLRYYQYANLKSTHIDAIVDELLKNHRTGDEGGGRNYTICIAAEFVKLDSQLSRDTTYKDLNYKFECATCRSSVRMNINALLDQNQFPNQDSNRVTHVGKY